MMPATRTGDVAAQPPVALRVMVQLVRPSGDGAAIGAEIYRTVEIEGRKSPASS